MVYEVVAGWTAAIDIDLLTKGATPSGTMSGMTVSLVLKDKFGVPINTAGDVSIQDSSNWIVRYVPDPTDLIVGTFFGRIKVTDAAGGIAYFPSSDPDIWIIRSETV